MKPTIYRPCLSRDAPAPCKDVDPPNDAPPRRGRKSGPVEIPAAEPSPTR